MGLQLNTKLFILKAESELRFEVREGKEKLTLELKAGFAEIFGSEIVIGKKYEFSGGAKIGVFTYQGCKLNVTGQLDLVYDSTVTPMYMYGNCHLALENMRNAASKENRRGPVTMIVGSRDSGKSSLSQILLNYGVKVGRVPMFIDLDVSSGQISVPGTVGALLVTRPIDPVDGFYQQKPLVYHFGHTTPTANVTLYNHLVSHLAKICSLHLPDKKSVQSSGIIINTPGWSEENDFQLLNHAVQAFKVDVILVLDHEKLQHKLQKNLPKSVYVVSLPKNGGVVSHTDEQKNKMANKRVHEYFYGSRLKLYPHSIELKWTNVKIYKIGTPALPASCLPLGTNIEDFATRLVPVTPGPRLLHHMLAVILIKEDKETITQNAIGFFCVTNVNTVKRTITMLSPQPRMPPNAALLLSDVQFVDS